MCPGTPTSRRSRTVGARSTTRAVPPGPWRGIPGPRPTTKPVGRWLPDFQKGAGPRRPVPRPRPCRWLAAPTARPGRRRAPGRPCPWRLNPSTSANSRPQCGRSNMVTRRPGTRAWNGRNRVERVGAAVAHPVAAGMIAQGGPVAGLAGGAAGQQADPRAFVAVEGVVFQRQARPAAGDFLEGGQQPAAGPLTDPFPVGGVQGDGQQSAMAFQ